MPIIFCGKQLLIQERRFMWTISFKLIPFGEGWIWPRAPTLIFDAMIHQTFAVQVNNAENIN